MENSLDHLCIIVKDVGDVREFFMNKGIKVSEVEAKDGVLQLSVDGNRERAKLLFVQVVGEGSYKNSLIKHGYGIHHAAIVVGDLKSFLKGIEMKGWYLHPISLGTYEESNKVWLTRPGYPILLEVFEDTEKNKRLNLMEGFVEEIYLPNSYDDRKLIEVLNTKELKTACLTEGRIRIGEEFYIVRDFYEEIV